MICGKECKAFVEGTCLVTGDQQFAGVECPIDFLAAKKAEINASDRGDVKYICLDIPVDESEDPEECVYGTAEEGDCKHLVDGGHPKDCDKARLKPGSILLKKGRAMGASQADEVFSGDEQKKGAVEE